MKVKRYTFGDCYKTFYKTGKHEFATVEHAKLIHIGNLEVGFEAEDLFINGMRISNDEFQAMMNIYIGRMQTAKELNKEVNRIKAKNPSIDMFDACDMAHRNLNK